MSFFSNQRWPTWSVVILIALNLLTLSIIWFARSDNQSQAQEAKPRSSVEQFLERELELDERQAQNFRVERERHFERTRKIMKRMHRLKRELHAGIAQPSMDSLQVYELAERIGNYQAELEIATFDHFARLRELCSKEQQERFDSVIHEAFRLMKPRPPRHKRPGGKPPA